jgi:hypothetical protein
MTNTRPPYEDMATEDSNADFDRIAIAAEVLHQVREELRTLIRDEVQRAFREENNNNNNTVSRSNRYNSNNNQNDDDDADNDNDNGYEGGTTGRLGLHPLGGHGLLDGPLGLGGGLLGLSGGRGRLTGELVNSPGLSSLMGWGGIPEVPRLSPERGQLDLDLKKRRYGLQ